MGYYGRGNFEEVDAIPRPFLVLERLSGTTLLSMLTEPPSIFSRDQNSRCVIPYPKAMDIAVSLADALSYLHERFHSEAMIIHRDIKPDNVGFTDRGIAKLMDFGLSICVRRRQFAEEAYEMTGKNIE